MKEEEEEEDEEKEEEEEEGEGTRWQGSVDSRGRKRMGKRKSSGKRERNFPLLSSFHVNERKTIIKKKVMLQVSSN